MTLRGTRTDWEELLRRNDEGGVGLKDLHLECIQYALDWASPDAQMIDVDASLASLQQVQERAPEIDAKRAMASDIADRDESWWLHRARELGLMSIVPVEPWPRQPENFIRPRGYLHTY